MLSGIVTMYISIAHPIDYLFHHRWGVDMNEFPNIKSIEAHVSQLPAFKAGHADVQPDAPKQS